MKKCVLVNIVIFFACWSIAVVNNVNMGDKLKETPT